MIQMDPDQFFTDFLGSGEINNLDDADDHAGIHGNAKATKELIRKRKAIAKAYKQFEQLNNNIATKRCPLNIGDDVFYQNNKKEWKGQVSHIGYATNFSLFFDIHSYDAPLYWVVYLKRYNKGTRMLGNFTFNMSQDTHYLENGLWKELERPKSSFIDSILID